MPQDCSILFFGDLVGKAGRNAVLHYLAGLPQKPDVVIVNGENTTHGFGLSEKHYYELLEGGVDIITGGNHIFDRRDSLTYMDDAERLVRPANFAGQVPGQGARVISLGAVKIGVLSVLGQAFMANYNSPMEAMERYLPQLLQETPIVFVDIHAESTAEKLCLGHLASSLGASAVVGSHTHVQTADEQLLTNRTGYITDAGFNGSRHSVIGMEVHSALNRMRSPAPTRLEVCQEPEVQINAVRFQVDPLSGYCNHVERIRQHLTLAEFE